MTAGVVVRSRARERNTRAAIVSFGLLALAALCGYLLLGGISLGGRSPATRAARPHRIAAAPAVTHASTTTASTTTVTTAPLTIATDPITAAPIVVLPTTVVVTTTIPPTTTTTTVVTTTTAARVTASVRVTDSPNWCTVVVTLSTGAQGTYDLAPYLSEAGDSYVLDAKIGGYTVHVDTIVVTRDNAPQCSSSVSAPSHA